MIEFISFLVLVLIGVIINRVMAWGRRADARHRARFIAAGYRENFPAFRLRQDKRKRIALVAWVILAGLPMLMNHDRPFHHISPETAFLTDFMGMWGAAVPAGILWAAMFFYMERTRNDGLFVVNDLVKKFHAPPVELLPDGSYGSARMMTASEIGLINLQGMQTRGFRPIVTEDRKDGEK